MGYRLWRIRDGQLLSLVNDTVWPPTHALEARCEMDGVRAALRLALVVLVVGWIALRWGIPISEYDERSGPPIHLGCPMFNSWLGRQGKRVLEVILVRRIQRRWHPVGLAELQEAAPQWFRAAAQEEM